MASEDDEDLGEQNVEPAAPLPTEEVPHSEALGLSSRGNNAPTGHDVGATPVTATAPAPTDPAQLAPVERDQVRQAARENLDAQAKAQWEADYASGKAVNPRGWQYQSRSGANARRPDQLVNRSADYQQAESQAVTQATQARQQGMAEEAQRKQLWNSQAEVAMNKTGQKFERDERGFLRPKLDPTTNQPVYNKTGWEKAINPQTGQPALKSRAENGQTNYKDPVAVSSPDLKDNQIYYEYPDGSREAAGSIDDLAEHKNPHIARVAIAARSARAGAWWREALAPKKQALDQAEINIESAKVEAGQTETRAAQLQQQITNLSKDPANADRVNRLNDQLNALNEQAGNLRASIDPKGNGVLTTTRDVAKLQHDTMEMQMHHGAYGNLADERRMILKATGKSEKDDPILQNILAQQQKAADSLQAMNAAPAGNPPMGGKARAAATGERLATGQRLGDVGGGSLKSPTTPMGLYAAPEGGKSNVLVDEAGAARVAAAAAIPKTVSPEVAQKPSTTAPSSGVPAANAKAAAGAQIDPTTGAVVDEPWQLSAKGEKGIPGMPLESVISRYGSGGAADEKAAAGMVPRLKELQTALPNMGKTLESLKQQIEGAKDATARGRLVTQHNELVKKYNDLRDEEIKRFGDYQGARVGTAHGPVDPDQVVKLKQRVQEIDHLLGGSNQQLSASARADLEKQRDYLEALGNQRYSRMKPDDQKRVDKLAAPATSGDTMKGIVKDVGARLAESGSSVVTGAGAQMAMLPEQHDEFGVRDPVVQKQVAADRALTPSQKFEKVKSDPVYRLGTFIGDAARDYYQKSPQEEKSPVGQFVGSMLGSGASFAPLLASGPAAPAVIGLQTVGNDIDRIYQEQIGKGKTKDEAADFAMKRAMLSGALQAAIFEAFPAPLRGQIDKAVVNRIAKGTADRAIQFVRNRGAMAIEGAVLGGTTQLASNLAEGRPAGENVGETAAAMGLSNLAFPRGGPARPKAEPIKAPAKAAEPSPAAEAKPKYEPAGEAKPSTAKEAAAVLAPEETKAAEEAKKNAPEPKKNAEESAQVFKAQEKLSRREAAKEKTAQKLVDQIQSSSGQSRDDILKSREGKDTDEWIKHLQDEAKYHANPLVVDPERRSRELREQIKASDEAWAKHTEDVAEEARLKRAAQEKGENFAADQTGKQAAYEQLKARRESMTRELEAADRLRQSNEGGALLKNDLSAQQNGGERPEAPARENAQAVPTAAEEQAAHDKMTASEPAKQADQLLGEIVRLKNLPAGSAERARLPEVEQAYSKALDTRTKSPEYTDWQDKYMRRVKDQAGRATKEEPTNAVQEQSPGKETVRNPPGDGKKVGGGNPVDQGAAGKSASTPEARTKAVREKVAALPDTPVKLTYTHAETGKPAEVELPAKQAGKRLADHLETLGKIFDCLHA